ncbi:MAG: formylglycine-generating enzyme family protein [Stappiaceae bacterium]
MSEEDAGLESCCIPSHDGALPISPGTAVGTTGREFSSRKLPDRMIPIKGGKSHVGTRNAVLTADGEGPLRRVTLQPYRIDPLTVTNAWFSDFIEDTGYQTDAEAYGWSLVFHSFLDDSDRLQAPVHTPWWRKVHGADWAHPLGPGSDWRPHADHPAIHVSWNDAMAFADWAGARLPTEAEWEHAARGGAGEARFPWGDEEPSDTHVPCNIWQGQFPDHNTCLDGYAGTAPARSFEPNSLGLYNMVGNVWEWCADIFRVRSQRKAAKELNKRAPQEGIRLLKGGSYLCHTSYCYRYRIAARTGVRADTSTGHSGFRIVAD